MERAFSKNELFDKTPNKRNAPVSVHRSLHVHFFLKTAVKHSNLKGITNEQPRLLPW